MAEPTLLYLLRHGQATPEGMLLGQLDLPLLPEGEEEAEKWAAALSSCCISAVWSSPLVRALNTARIIAKAVNKQPEDKQSLVQWGRVTALPVDGLQEISLGQWEGRRKREIMRQYADLWERRGLDPANVAPPGGESFTMLSQRVLPIFARLCKESAGRKAALIVAHQAVNRAILAHCMQVPLMEVFTIPQEEAALNILSYDNGRVEVIDVNLSLDSFSRSST